MALYKVDIPATLTTGEYAQFGHYLTAASDVVAQAAALAFFNSLGGAAAFKSQFPTSCVFGPAKISATDLTTGRVTATFSAGVPFAGTAINTVLPPQCSMVVTLRTALAGASFRGRMYVPTMVVAAITTLGRFAAANVTQVLGAVKAAFDAEIVAAGTPVVYSRHLRTTTAVTQLEIGDVVDTQRKRRDKLIESRQTAAV